MRRVRAKFIVFLAIFFIWYVVKIFLHGLKHFFIFQNMFGIVRNPSSVIQEFLILTGLILSLDTSKTWKTFLSLASFKTRLAQYLQYDAHPP